MKPTAQEFERLALEQMDMLYRVAFRLARNADRASDLVQETYLRAFRSRDSFDLQAVGIRPWLIRILHNLHITRSERDRRHPVATENEVLEAAQAPAKASVEFSSAQFEHMDERLVRALNQLPEEYQLVMLLWAVEELSYKEIADAVNVPIGTVMSRLHRARQRLTEDLQTLAKEERLLRE
jgi:RNA polymerase sigma-70 factor, ECF subfamily